MARTGRVCARILPRAASARVMRRRRRALVHGQQCCSGRQVRRQRSVQRGTAHGLPAALRERQRVYGVQRALRDIGTRLRTTWTSDCVVGAASRTSALIMEQCTRPARKGCECTDNNSNTNGDRCDSSGACTACGDGVRNGPEVCDDGNTVTETSCPPVSRRLHRLQCHLHRAGGIRPQAYPSMTKSWRAGADWGVGPQSEDPGEVPLLWDS